MLRSLSLLPIFRILAHCGDHISSNLYMAHCQIKCSFSTATLWMLSNTSFLDHPWPTPWNTLQGECTRTKEGPGCITSFLWVITGGELMYIYHLFDLQPLTSNRRLSPSRAGSLYPSYLAPTRVTSLTLLEGRKPGLSTCLSEISRQLFAINLQIEHGSSSPTYLTSSSLITRRS